MRVEIKDLIQTCQLCLYPPYSSINCSIPEDTFSLNEIAISH